jgi:hypothetical protein
MRDFLDEILAFIGSESLTDAEFEATLLPDPPAYTTLTYLALKDVLASREAVSGQAERLKLYFQARGVDLGADEPAKEAKSNIFIGSKL